MALTGVPGGFIFSLKITEEEPGGDFMWQPGLLNVSSVHSQKSYLAPRQTGRVRVGGPLGWEQDKQSDTGSDASV